MKKILFTLLTGLFMSLAALAQNYTITVYGTVSMVVENSIVPIANQAVTVTIDSSSTGFTYQNTVFTDETGYYEDVIDNPGFTGHEFVQTSTFDSCLSQYLYNGQQLIPGVTLIPMDFLICNSISPECQSMFIFYQVDPADPFTYSFMNLSTGSYTQLTWSFGDSTYSNEANPVHTFPSEGNYYVCLTISDGTFCNSTYCEIVYAGSGGGWNGCENYFIYNYDYNEPNTLLFEGYMYNGQQALYYSWDFGDGTTGTGPTVTHTYQPQGFGMYMVGLTTMTMDSLGIDSCFYTTYQEVWIENQTSDCESFIMLNNIYGLTVDLQGYTISQYPTDFMWEFGDGATGTGEYISHTYSSPGMYNVYLNTVDATGCTYQTITQIWLDSTYQGCSNYFTYDQADSNTYSFYGWIYLNNGETYPDSSATYSWDFGDGTSGTGQTVTHYFQENPAGYNVCLTTAVVLPDGSVCTSVYCEYIATVDPSFNIFGIVYLENNLLADQAVVHLMSMDSLWQGVVEIGSTTIDSGGFYSFPEIPMYNGRLYFTQAELTEGSVYFGDYLPTYHLSAMSWEQASPILPLNNWPAEIFMIPGSPVEGGSGTITGVVTELGSRGFMNDVEVVLMDSESTPLTYRRSDDQGFFSFENLPFGTYIIHAEIMGIHTIQAEISLSEEDPVSSVEVLVSGTEANFVFGMPEHRISLGKVGDVFPNPVNDNAQVEITVKKTANLQVSTFSQTGQIISVNALTLQEGTHIYQLETESLPIGLYLLSISTDQGEVVSRKFMRVQ